jgi:hypothetical protein
VLVNSIVFSRTDIAVWTISAIIAVAVGWSRYVKMKTREKLVGELAAMDPERREKVLSRLNPKAAAELRERLMRRFH